MSAKRKKNMKFFSSLLATFLLNTNASSAMINRPDIAGGYCFDDEEDDDLSTPEAAATGTILFPVILGVTGYLINKKLYLSNTSVLDNISSGFQRLCGFPGVRGLADQLDLPYAMVVSAVSLGGKQLNAGWSNELSKLAQELQNHGGWVSSVDALSTYWKLAVSVKTDLDLSFGRNTGALLKKLISNRSHLGTPFVVDKTKTFGKKVNGGGVNFEGVEYDRDSAFLVKPFTEDGGLVEDGISTLEGNDSDYWFAPAREWLIGAKKNRKSLFSVTSAMLQTYHLFYAKKSWEKQRIGKFNIEGTPERLGGDEGDVKCIYKDKIKTGGVDRGQWAWKSDKYVYVRLPSKTAGLEGGHIPAGNAWLAAQNGKDCDIPVYSNAINNTFVDAITADRTLNEWLRKSNDFDCKPDVNDHCRYIAIPLK